MIKAVTSVLLVAISLLTLHAAAAPTQQPPAVGAVGVTEHLGDRVPLDLPFTTAQGTSARLRDFVRGDRPILLVLAYARCEMLCSVVLQAVGEATSGIDLEPGRDYRPIVVSIDPRETPAEAARKQARLLERVGHPGEPERWPYLVGREVPVRQLAGALGFEYAWDPVARQYAHPAVVFVLTPDGRISRYLQGVSYPPAALASALRDAARGLVQPSEPGLVDELLRCFRFDPGSTRYAARLQRYFRAGAVVVFAMLASLVGGLVVWERRRQLA